MKGVTKLFTAPLGFRYSSYRCFSTDPNQKPSVPQPLVICGPSGVGKGTLVKRLLGEYDSFFEISVSHTTRKPRPGERDGKEYHFVPSEEFDKLIKNDEFLEHAHVHGNKYGTSIAEVYRIDALSKNVILEIDVQGAEQVSKHDFEPTFIWIDPPSVESLKERLLGRKTETEESLKLRVGNAIKELERSKKVLFFKKRIVNDDVDIAYKNLVDYLTPIYEL
eukprot:CAMPEP_0114978176 /NCGR_PEP_ID=MMETSP0216-20121206/3661_1 /TAXON_ID=223996 /ORGANISM="Protocruzia adherens, Strain Boccale" /LENGTH=220 /DNA_ID=CAMNT_0002339343 /DNA_START=41 /DNA_END=703 /DNA_ORIENTATION=+